MRPLIFTWNAFQIECDPNSVIQTIQSFDLGPSNLQDGESYAEADAGAPGILSEKRVNQGGAVFTVQMPIDPDAVRHKSARSDVIVGQLLNKQITFEAALEKRLKEKISGTISETFETDINGNVVRRVRVSKVVSIGSDGQSEIRTSTENLERRPIPDATP